MENTLETDTSEGAEDNTCVLQDDENYIQEIHNVEDSDEVVVIDDDSEEIIIEKLDSFINESAEGICQYDTGENLPKGNGGEVIMQEDQETVSDNMLEDNIERSVSEAENQTEDNATENVDEENLLENQSKDNATENVDEENLLENQSQDNVTENVDEENLLENQSEDNVTENVDEENLLENQSEDNVMENVDEENLLENQSQDNVMENVDEENLIENQSEDNVTENVDEENLLENQSKDNATENVDEENLLENQSKDDATENVDEENLLENQSQDNVTENVDEENLLENQSKDNATENVDEENMPDTITNGDNVTEDDSLRAKPSDPVHSTSEVGQGHENTCTSTIKITPSEDLCNDDNSSTVKGGCSDHQVPASEPDADLDEDFDFPSDLNLDDFEVVDEISAEEEENKDTHEESSTSTKDTDVAVCVLVDKVPKDTRVELLQSYFPTASKIQIPQINKSSSYGHAVLEFTSSEEATKVTNKNNSCPVKIAGNQLRLLLLKDHAEDSSGTKKPGRKSDTESSRSRREKSRHKSDDKHSYHRADSRSSRRRSRTGGKQNEKRHQETSNSKKLDTTNDKSKRTETITKSRGKTSDPGIKTTSDSRDDRKKSEHRGEPKKSEYPSDQKKSVPSKDKHKSVIEENTTKKASRSDGKSVKGKISDDPKNQLQPDHFKKQLPEVDSKKQLTPGDSKKQLPGGDSKKQLPQVDSKKQLTPGDSKKQLPGGDSKKQLPQVDSKKQLTPGDSMKQLAGGDSKKQLPRVDSKKQLTPGDSKKQLRGGDSKKQLSQNDAKRRLTLGDSKKQLAEGDSKKVMEQKLSPNKVQKKNSPSKPVSSSSQNAEKQEVNLEKGKTPTKVVQKKPIAQTNSEARKPSLVGTVQKQDPKSESKGFPIRSAVQNIQQKVLPKKAERLESKTSDGQSDKKTPLLANIQTKTEQKIKEKKVLAKDEQKKPLVKKIQTKTEPKDVRKQGLPTTEQENRAKKTAAQVDHKSAKRKNDQSKPLSTTVQKKPLKDLKDIDGSKLPHANQKKTPGNVNKNLTGKEDTKPGQNTTSTPTKLISQTKQTNSGRNMMTLAKDGKITQKSTTSPRVENPQRGTRVTSTKEQKQNQTHISEEGSSASPKTSNSKNILNSSRSTDARKNQLSSTKSDSKSDRGVKRKIQENIRDKASSEKQRKHSESNDQSQKDKTNWNPTSSHQRARSDRKIESSQSRGRRSRSPVDRKRLNRDRDQHRSSRSSADSRKRSFSGNTSRSPDRKRPIRSQSRERFRSPKYGRRLSRDVVGRDELMSDIGSASRRHNYFQCKSPNPYLSPERYYIDDVQTRNIQHESMVDQMLSDARYNSDIITDYQETGQHGVQNIPMNIQNQSMFIPNQSMNIQTPQAMSPVQQLNMHNQQMNIQNPLIGSQDTQLYIQYPQMNVQNLQTNDQYRSGLHNPEWDLQNLVNVPFEITNIQNDPMNIQNQSVHAQNPPMNQQNSFMSQGDGIETASIPWIHQPLNHQNELLQTTGNFNTSRSPVRDPNFASNSQTGLRENNQFGSLNMSSSQEHSQAAVQNFGSTGHRGAVIFNYGTDSTPSEKHPKYSDNDDYRNQNFPDIFQPFPNQRYFDSFGPGSKTLSTTGNPPVVQKNQHQKQQNVTDHNRGKQSSKRVKARSTVESGADQSNLQQTIVKPDSFYQGPVGKEDPRRVYVGNLPPGYSGVTETKLFFKSEMQKRGIGIDMVNPVRTTPVLYDPRNEGKPCLIAEFPSSELARESVEKLSGVVFRGHLLTLRMAKHGEMSRNRGKSTNDLREERLSVLVYNVPDKALSAQLGDFIMQKLVDIDACRPDENPIKQIKMRKGRDFQVVIFKKYEYAGAAIARLNGIKFMGSILRIVRSIEQKEVEGASFAAPHVQPEVLDGFQVKVMNVPIAEVTKESFVQFFNEHLMKHNIGHAGYSALLRVKFWPRRNFQYLVFNNEFQGAAAIKALDGVLFKKNLLKLSSADQVNEKDKWDIPVEEVTVYFGNAGKSDESNFSGFFKRRLKMLGVLEDLKCIQFKRHRLYQLMTFNNRKSAELVVEKLRGTSFNGFIVHVCIYNIGMGEQIEEEEVIVKFENIGTLTDREFLLKLSGLLVKLGLESYMRQIYFKYTREHQLVSICGRSRAEYIVRELNGVIVDGNAWSLSIEEDIEPKPPFLEKTKKKGILKNAKDVNAEGLPQQKSKYESLIGNAQYFDEIAVEEDNESDTEGENLAPIWDNKGSRCPVKTCIFKKIFKTFVSYSQHWKKCHVPVMGFFPCPLCNHTTIKKRELTRHLQFSHFKMEDEAENLVARVEKVIKDNLAYKDPGDVKCFRRPIKTDVSEITHPPLSTTPSLNLATQQNVTDLPISRDNRSQRDLSGLQQQKIEYEVVIGNAPYLDEDIISSYIIEALGEEGYVGMEYEAKRNFQYLRFSDRGIAERAAAYLDGRIFHLKHLIARYQGPAKIPLVMIKKEQEEKSRVKSTEETIQIAVEEGNESDSEDDNSGPIWDDKGTRCLVKTCTVNMTFRSLSSYSQHWRKFHVPTFVNFPCPFCHRAFNQKRELARHFESSHFIKVSDSKAVVAQVEKRFKDNLAYIDPGEVKCFRKPTKQELAEITHRPFSTRTSLNLTTQQNVRDFTISRDNRRQPGIYSGKPISGERFYPGGTQPEFQKMQPTSSIYHQVDQHNLSDHPVTKDLYNPIYREDFRDKQSIGGPYNLSNRQNTREKQSSEDPYRPSTQQDLTTSTVDFYNPTDEPDLGENMYARGLCDSDTQKDFRKTTNFKLNPYNNNNQGNPQYSSAYLYPGKEYESRDSQMSEVLYDQFDQKADRDANISGDMYNPFEQNEREDADISRDLYNNFDQKDVRDTQGISRQFENPSNQHGFGDTETSRDLYNPLDGKDVRDTPGDNRDFENRSNQHGFGDTEISRDLYNPLDGKDVRDTQRDNRDFENRSNQHGFGDTHTCRDLYNPLDGNVRAKQRDNRVFENRGNQPDFGDKQISRDFLHGSNKYDHTEFPRDAFYQGNRQNIKDPQSFRDDGIHGNRQGIRNLHSSKDDSYTGHKVAATDPQIAKDLYQQSNQQDRKDLQTSRDYSNTSTSQDFKDTEAVGGHFYQGRDDGIFGNTQDISASRHSKDLQTSRDYSNTSTSQDFKDTEAVGGHFYQGRDDGIFGNTQDISASRHSKDAYYTSHKVAGKDPQISKDFYQHGNQQYVMDFKDADAFKGRFNQGSQGNLRSYQSSKDHMFLGNQQDTRVAQTLEDSGYPRNELELAGSQSFGNPSYSGNQQNPTDDQFSRDRIPAGSQKDFRYSKTSTGLQNPVKQSSYKDPLITGDQFYPDNRGTVTNSSSSSDQFRANYHHVGTDAKSSRDAAYGEPRMAQRDLEYEVLVGNTPTGPPEAVFVSYMEKMIGEDRLAGVDYDPDRLYQFIRFFDEKEARNSVTNLNKVKFQGRPLEMRYQGPKTHLNKKW